MLVLPDGLIVAGGGDLGSGWLAACDPNGQTTWQTGAGIPEAKILDLGFRDRQLFLRTVDDRFSCRDVATGRRLWSLPSAVRAWQVDGSKLFWGGDAGLGCVDVEDGQPEWSFPFTGPSREPETVLAAPGRVWAGGKAGSAAGWLACYDAATGRLLRELPVRRGWPVGLHAPGVDADQLIAAGCASGNRGWLAGYEGEHDEPSWERILPGKVTRFHPERKVLWVCGSVEPGQGWVGCYDMSGRTVWLRKPEALPGDVTAFLPAGDHLLVWGQTPAHQGWLACFRARDGKPLWLLRPGELPGLVKAVRIAGSRVVAGGASGPFQAQGWLGCYGLEDGRFIWDGTAREFPLGIVTLEIREDRIYAARAGRLPGDPRLQGRVCCFRLD